MSLQNSIAQLVNKAMDNFLDKLADKTREVQTIPREWEAYRDKTTRRRNPAAPMRVVGSYRDNVDYGQMVESTRANHENKSVEIDTDYASEVYEDKPIFEEVLSKYPVRDLFIEALEEAVRDRK